MFESLRRHMGLSIAAVAIAAFTFAPLANAASDPWTPNPQTAPSCAGGATSQVPSSAPCSNPTAHGWELFTPFETPRDSFAAATARDGRIFVIGGRTVDGPTANVEVYNPATNLWSPAAPLPHPRYLFAAATGIDGRIYAVGGADGVEYDTTLVIYDPAQNTWTFGASMSAPRHSLAVAAGTDGTIYAIGGIYGSPLATVEAYDPVANKWTTRNDLPIPRYAGAATTSADGRIYLAGGISQLTSTVAPTSIASVQVYNAGLDSWSDVQPLTTARYGLALVTGPNGTLWALGGYNSVQSRMLETVEVYSTASNTWSPAPPMLCAHGQYVGGASGMDGTVYALGGYSAMGIVERYAPH